jgi:hypothetical protein
VAELENVRLEAGLAIATAFIKTKEAKAKAGSFSDEIEDLDDEVLGFNNLSKFATQKSKQKIDFLHGRIDEMSEENVFLNQALTDAEARIAYLDHLTKRRA